MKVRLFCIIFVRKLLAIEDKIKLSVGIGVCKNIACQSMEARGMTKNNLRNSIVLSSLLCLIIFIVELITPRGVSESTLYVIVILASLQSKHRRFVLLMMIICICLTILGYFLSPESIELWKSVANRTFSIFAIVVVGFIGLNHFTAEESLRESEERYRNVLNHMLEGTQIIGFDWRYLYINEEAAKQGHQTRENLIGHTMMEVYPGIENTHLFSVLKNCMEERLPYLMENKFTYPDGTTGWFTLSIQPVTEGLFILSNDITERKIAEKNLYELNMELEQRVDERTKALESSLNLIYSLYQVAQSVVNFNNLSEMLQSIVETVSRTLSTDRATIIIFDHEIKKVTHLVKYGLGADNVVEGVSYEELMHGLSGWALKELQPVISPKGKPDPREGLQAQQRRIETNCGSIVVLPLTYHGKALGTLTVINSPDQPDFTTQEINWMEAIATQAALAIGRAQIYAQLNQSEEKFRLAAWATKDAIWDWNLKTNVIEWGTSLQKMFNYPTEVIETTDSWRLDHIHPHDRPKVERSIQQVFENNMEFWSKEYRFERMDKTYANVMDRGYVLRDETGKPYRIIGAMMDITEQKESEQILQEFNNKLAVSLNAIEQRNAEISGLNKMLSNLHQITLDLLKLQETDKLLSRLVELSADFLDASYAEVMLVEEDSLVVHATTQNQLHLMGHRMNRESAMLSWQAFDTLQPVVLSDYSTWSHRRDIYEAIGLHAVAGFPILNNQQCIGVFAVGRKEENYEFTQDQIQFGNLFASLAALIITNTQLRESLKQQSIRDPLTGLFNRRYMEEMLTREISRASRELHPLSIMMIDVDYFKRFNDTFGHTTGDKLLRDVGRFLQSHVRGEDIACRYGGEEFILIMPNANLETAQKRAEQICIEARNIKLEGTNAITLSLGVAVYPQHGKMIDTVIQAADAALYQAKQNGRNRIEVAK